MTVADKEGNMVSLIQSNYRGMGSGMVPPKLGFMLQDRGELFDLEEKAQLLRQKTFHTSNYTCLSKDQKNPYEFYK
jgi:gamma-glutamyltranspeptidase/glutathione hydrolase